MARQDDTSTGTAGTEAAAAGATRDGGAADAGDGGARVTGHEAGTDRRDPGYDPAERARDAVDHLQAAARELIAAARSALDLADDLVNDREAVAAAARTIASLGDLVRHAPRPEPWGDQAAPRQRDGAGGPGDPADRRPGAERIERIRVL